MAFVQRINSGNNKEDPYYEVIGLVTMEDVIEALIQAEINDETDVWGKFYFLSICSEMHVGVFTQISATINTKSLLCVTCRSQEKKKISCNCQLEP